jgi:peptidoglycan/LPS O-acetylase OafA/YrhL
LSQGALLAKVISNRENDVLKTDRATGRMHFADGLRGIAAMWVVLFHLSAGHHIDALRASLPETVNRLLFDSGHGGVAIFFVLSGFVMAMTVQRAAMDGAGARRFLLRRLTRLCPPYWLAIAVTTALAFAKGTPIHAGQLLANVFFLQGLLGFDNINVVFWTLCIEIQFYAAFAALTWASDAIGGRTVPRLLIALLSLAWPLGLLTGPVVAGSFLPFWIFFMSGVLALDASRGPRVPRVLAMAFGLLLLGLGLVRNDLFSTLAGLTTIALIAACLGTGMQTWLSSRPLQFLGTVSYSLYLFHNPVTGVAFRVMGKLSARHSVGVDLLCSAVAIGVCVAVAWVAWFTVERAAISWSHRLSQTRTPSPAPVVIESATVKP